MGGPWSSPPPAELERPRRLVAAVLAGSLSAMIPVCLGAFYERPGEDWIFIYLYLAGLAYTVSALVYLTLVLLPAHLALVAKGWERWWAYPSIGAVFAVAAFTAFDLWTGGWSPREYPMPVVVGVLSSVTFWAIVRERS